MKPLAGPDTGPGPAIRSTVLELKLHGHDLRVLKLLAIVVRHTLDVTGAASSNLQFFEQ